MTRNELNAQDNAIRADVLEILALARERLDLSEQLRLRMEANAISARLLVAQMVCDIVP